MIDPDAAVCEELLKHINNGNVSLVSKPPGQSAAGNTYYIYVYQMHGGILRLEAYECAIRERRRRNIRELCLKHLGII